MKKYFKKVLPSINNKIEYIVKRNVVSLILITFCLQCTILKQALIAQSKGSNEIYPYYVQNLKNATDREHVRLKYNVLKENFLNPPNIAKPKVYWFWLNGAVDTVRVKEELEAFKNAGISGVDIFDIGSPELSDTKEIVDPGPAFMSDEYIKNIAVAIESAEELEIEVGLNLASSWNAGGSWVPPEHAAKSLYFSKLSVSGPGSHHIPLPFPEIPEEDEVGRRINVPLDSTGRPAFHEEVAVIAFPEHNGKVYPDTSRILNLTEFFNPETESLTWDAPEGEWEVYRYVVANSGRELILPSENSNGPIIDHFDAQAMEFHMTYFIDRLSPVIDDFSKSALTYFYLDSYEARGFIWTPELPEAFKEKHGYDLYKLLPSLHIQNEGYIESLYKSDELAQGFLNDFNNTISDMMIANHFRKGSEIAKKAGLTFYAEAAGPGLPLHNVPVEPLGALGAVDGPRGEFWHDNSRYVTEGFSFPETDSVDLLQNVKGPAAAGNIYKKRTVEMEAFTSWRHWQEGPFDIKPTGDRAFMEGMNRIVFHNSSHNPSGTGFPGIALHAGTHYNDKRVWWPKIKPFNEYLARISYMAQQGHFKSDVLYYHGDQAPKIVRPKNADFAVAPGYDYEVINTEILLNNLTVTEDGLLHLPDVGTYRLLVMEPSEQINPLALKKLTELAKQGAIILGEKPSRKIGLGFRNWDEDRLQKIISESWFSVSEQPLNNEDLSQGKIIEGITARKMLGLLQVKPDIRYDGQQLNSPLDYIHYQYGDMNYYFIRNTTDEWLTKKVFFRQRNKMPELWDPVTGEQNSLSVYQVLDDQIGIPLTFKPYDAYFVVFRDGNGEPIWEEILNSEGKIPAFEATDKGYLFREPGSVQFQDNEKTQIVSSNVKSFPMEGEWNLTFPKNWGAPRSAVFPELVPWAEVENEGIKYFSGIATYQKKFSLSFEPDTLSDNTRIYINLGKIEKVGEAWLNGTPLGISWAKPYEYDVTEYLNRGENELTVEVANVWANRIIGDARTGQDFTNTNIKRVTRPTIRPWEEVSLIPSGLLGPATIQLRKIILSDYLIE